METAFLISNSGAQTNYTGVPVDWYGNTTLHHCFANSVVDTLIVKTLLLEHPEFVGMKNQFGRLPLHYALDRIRVNIDGISLLIDSYPEGVSERDVNGIRPYDIAIKWKHSNAIKKLLLDVNPSLDYATYMKLKYGPLSNLLLWMYHGRLLESRNYQLQESGDNSLTDNVPTTFEMTEENSNSNLNSSNNNNSSYAANRNSFQRTSSWSSLLSSSIKNTASSIRRRSFGGVTTNISRIHSIDQDTEDAEEGNEAATLSSVAAPAPAEQKRGSRYEHRDDKEDEDEDDEDSHNNDVYVFQIEPQPQQQQQHSPPRG